MARDGDRIAVTGFDAAARQSTGEFITIDGMASRRRLKEAIRAIGNDGEWTDFTAGLGEAHRLLASAGGGSGGAAPGPGAERGARQTRIVVFLTDGKCEPDPEGPLVQNLAKGPRSRRRAQAELACQNHVLDEIAPALGEFGARVHAIGLSRGAPTGFLEELGRRTDGRGSVTLDPRALPELFAEVYAGILGSRLTVGDAETGVETFELLDGAETCDVVIVGAGEQSEALLDPDGVEMPLHNRDPERAYFVGTSEYRFFKIARPKAGRWSLRMSGQSEKSPPRPRAGSQTRRYAILQHFDLDVEYVAPPTAVERGKAVTLRARLASPGGTTPPGDFLDRHIMKAVVAPVAPSVIGGVDNPLRKLASLDRPGRITLEMRRQDDGTFVATYTPTELGAVDLGLRLEPRPDGILSRSSGILATIDVVPPVHLTASAISFGQLKQDSTAQATLSLAGSEVGVALDLAVTLTTQGSAPESAPGGGTPEGVSPEGVSPGGISIDVTSLALASGPDTAREFPLTVTIDRDATPGPHQLVLQLTPTSPAGFDDRALAVPVTIDIVALTFWERHGTLVKYTAGAVLAFLILIGFLAPARFKKRAILGYMDLRDPDLPRRSSYPIGTRAKRGFYRAARIAVGPSGPVKKSGIVELRAISGGAVLATPSSDGATVYKTEIPRDDMDEADPFDASFGSGGFGDEDDERPRVPLKDGSFRMAPRVGYQVASTELVFWLE